MPRLDSFTLRIKTGKSGMTGPPQYVINGFLVEFEKSEGGTAPGETIELTGEPGSFPHTLLLCGPKQGTWDLEEVTATYHCTGEEPYSYRFGAVTLDDTSDLNIWQERPAPVFDV